MEDTAHNICENDQQVTNSTIWILLTDAHEDLLETKHEYPKKIHTLGHRRKAASLSLYILIKGTLYYSYKVPFMSETTPKDF